MEHRKERSWMSQLLEQNAKDAELNTLREKLRVAEDALIQAADVFEFYARHHATKNPIDDEKASRNYAHRNNCNIALAKIRSE